jgi:plastocyanin
VPPEVHIADHAQRGAQAAAGETTLTGRVTWHGARPAMAAIPIPATVSACGSSSPFQALHIGADQGVSGVVVTVEGVQGAVSPANVTIDQQGCNFVPHVVAVPVGGRLTFANHDSVLHSIHAFRGAASEFNLATPPGLTLTRQMTAAGTLRIQCDVGHNWMSGWIQVVNTPFVAVTDEHGAFRIPHLPAGNYTVRVWHEGWTPHVGGDGRTDYGAAVTHADTVAIPATGSVEHNFTIP